MVGGREALPVLVRRARTQRQRRRWEEVVCARGLDDEGDGRERAAYESDVGLREGSARSDDVSGWIGSVWRAEAEGERENIAQHYLVPFCTEVLVVLKAIQEYSKSAPSIPRI